MKITILIFICFFAIFGLGCQSSKNIGGVYSAKKNLNKFELFSDSTFIYKSAVFYGSSFANKYSDGTWKRTDNNSIILNSRIKSKLIPISIKKGKSDKDMVQVFENLIINQPLKKRSDMEYTEKDYCVIPYVNGQNYLDLHPELSDEPVIVDLRQMIGLHSDKTDKYIMNVPPIKRGSYCLSFNESVKSIYFEIEKRPEKLEYRTYYRLKTECVNTLIQSGELLTIDILVNDSLFSYRIFDNEVLKINDKKLIFKDKEENNKTNKLYLNK
jgi:hypothetical protein